ncbi:hypothetical protein HanPSC8_Chr17g0766421 [Helianthus annuus]|nr:hypothetical protein HanPSC8_Chr17g0766421 [Helianthus annuus]
MAILSWDLNKHSAGYMQQQFKQHSVKKGARRHAKPLGVTRRPLVLEKLNCIFNHE